jgi:hypothetical protein
MGLTMTNSGAVYLVELSIVVTGILSPEPQYNLGQILKPDARCTNE